MNLFKKSRLKKIEKQLQQAVIDRVTAIVVAHGVEKSADLISSFEVNIKDNVVEFLAFDYFIYLSKGRRPRVKKVPINALINWIRKEGISPRSGQSINQLAFAIQTSIFKKGITGKNYIDDAFDGFAEVVTEQFSDYTVKELANLIDKN